MAKKKPAKPKAPDLYSWDGGPKKHSIPQGVHDQNVEASRYGINLNQPVSQGLTLRDAYGLAQQASNAEYAPQIREKEQIGANAQPWFQNYVNGVTAQQTAAQNYAQPILNQANAWAGAPAQAAPGLDPNSAAGQQSAQASQSGSGLAKLGADVLASIATSTNDYMSGLKTTAAGQVPVAQAYSASQVAGLKGDQGARTAALYGQNRTDAVNQDIAYKTLTGTQANQQNQTLIDAGYDPTTGKKLPPKPKTGYGADAPGLNKYGYTADEWNALTPAKQAQERKGADTKAAKSAEKAQREKDKARKEKAKHQATIGAATGKIRNRITDIVGVYTGKATVTETDANGKKIDRDATSAERRDAVVGKYGYLGRIAIAVHEGRKLDQRAVDYLHNLDPNFRVPRAWIETKPKPGYGDQGGGT